MDEHKVVTTDAQIDEALKRARKHDNDPFATKATFLGPARTLVIDLNNGQCVAIPIESLQGLKGATTEQLSDVVIWGRGTGIQFPALDADFAVEALLRGVYGNKAWMMQLDRR